MLTDDYRRRRPGGFALLSAIVILVSALAQSGFAQTETGRVTGAVVDASGGVLPGVTVTLRAIGKETLRNAVTDTQGRYAFAALQPGPYEATFEIPGFAAKKVRTIVAIGASVSINPKLEVAGKSEEITVTAEQAVQVNTVSQEVSTRIDEKMIRELPTITRNPYDLVSLAGNVNDTMQSDPSVTSRGANGFNLNGQRSSSTNVMLDGASNNDEFSAGLGQDVPLDSVQEFSVITSNFSAEFGRATGGIVNVATKSGSNELHGTVYDFFRDGGLSTNTFDNKAREIEKSDFSRHQAGFSLGGPVIKDKLHFFVSTEYIRVRSETADVSLVPTPEFLARTSSLTQAYFADYPLASPISGRTITAGEIAGTTPGGAFSQLPSSLPVFGEVTRSLPTDAGGGLPRDDYQVVGRLDWSIDPKTQAFMRYAWQNADYPDGSNGNSPYQGFDTPVTIKNNNLLGSLTRIISPTLTSQTKFVWVKQNTDQPLGEQPPTPGLYMLNTPATIQGVRIALPGYLPYSPGQAIPSGGPQYVYQINQDINWVKSAHNFRFGGQYVYIRQDHTFGAFQNSVQTLGGSLGAALDNLVLGRIQQFNGAVDPQGKFPGETVTLPVSQPVFKRDNRYSEFALYANDSWSISSRLRLNLGMRYEYFGPQRNVDPQLDSNFYPGAGSNIYEQVRTGNVQIAPDSPKGDLWKADWNNFAPRLGFAWDVTGDGRTSLRGGWGMGYERNFGNVTFNVIQNPPNYAVLGIVGTAAAPLPIFRDNAGPLAGTGTRTLPAVTLRAVDPDIDTAFAHFWSLSLQRELTSNTVASVEYTGSAGRKQYAIFNANRPGGGLFAGEPVSTLPNGLDRPNPQYGNVNLRSNGGTSAYNGVTFGLESRNVRGSGLSLTARYTLSKAKDNLSNTFVESSNASITFLAFLDALDPNLDYGPAEFDVRHRFVTSGIWELPVAKGSTGAKRAALSGWQFAWILSAQSGAPFSIYDCTNGFFMCARMNQVSPVAGTTDTGTENPNEFTYLDLGNQASGVGSIVNEATGTNEIAPEGGYPSTMTKRNAFRRPGRYNVDMSLSKRIRMNDRFAVQLRLEVYNLLNHANLYVNDAATDVSQGLVLTAYRGVTQAGGFVGDGQRRIQLGAKFEF